jgi:hypothetical protein
MFLYEKTKLCKKAVQNDLINKMCFEQNAIEPKSAHFFVLFQAWKGKVKLLKRVRLDSKNVLLQFQVIN